ncbi:hypothetical protein MJO28_013164 [Puccinia striiformis f. sp. tritici]|uniref:protein-histidine N-methyltransferase n=3 Tax=Puccinia striiformis TaxID=27350 RepID=A0A0L0V3L1_9BASI|nr:hypothetical protein Pst134EA_024373 [Puccinia striiformis f. sp. tritici]KAI9614533.1 hypothetical protein KEM48_005999 [Puccinia striiformis f. sp. tritici PST-130]KNE93900.1 hypothetical protein PSTG_12703 [Puccinia striiformis f. sp. tritici PST-78]KAH9444805.1 hypothetical protein Pst134EB_025062 [Puccinia striiformis f. sp. tritici]KAH9453506.1 hypothetical protein Pst134EA_024373 [Puccinia striiformis f. sp. tritici]KAI7940879.1 hypothetical protein MJO28_013164 [Puccinia striiformis
MFKFDFDLDELTDECYQQEAKPCPDLNTNNTNEQGEASPCVPIPFKQLIDQLPPFITYSNLRINSKLTIYKRELYDAKYQTIVNLAGHEADEEEGNENKSEESGKGDQEEEEEENKKRETLDSLQSTSDLVPGIYEGGFKTWECSLDLANQLDPILERIKNIWSTNSSRQDPFRILEIGCGTAVPTITLCFNLFKFLFNFNQSVDCSPIGNNTLDDQQPTPILEIILQDFNSDVLKLLTFPNILLAYYRATQIVEQEKKAGRQAKDASVEESSSQDTKGCIGEEEGGAEGEEVTDEEEDLEITDELKTEFEFFLRMNRIRISFVYGPWSTFELPSSTSSDTTKTKVPRNDNNSGCQVILSSETLYSISSLPSFINVLKLSSQNYVEGDQCTILIASKSIYFGVGGGTHHFIDLVENTYNGSVKFIDLNHHQESENLVTLPSSNNHNGVARVLMAVKFSS